MQYLLDFIQEHTLEPQLALAAPSPSGVLELTWDRRQDPEHWQLRAERIHRSAVIAELEARGADMQATKHALLVMLADQIEQAHEALRDPADERVQHLVSGQQRFITDLQAAMEQMNAALSIVPGGGEQTALRSGHLSIVR